MQHFRDVLVSGESLEEHFKVTSYKKIDGKWRRQSDG